MMGIANKLPKLQTVTNFVRPFCKKHHFGTRFDSQHVKTSQILAKPPWERFYYAFSSFWGKLIWKMFPLVVREFLVEFFHTLTADGKYHVQDSEILPLPMQIHISEKRKTISQVFVPFMESTSNFKHFG